MGKYDMKWYEHILFVHVCSCSQEELKSMQVTWCKELRPRHPLVFPHSNTFRKGMCRMWCENFTPTEIIDSAFPLTTQIVIKLDV